MNKKFLSLVLALVLVLGTFTAVFAAETTEVKLTNADAKVQWLIDNKIVEGRKINENAENNDLALDKNITRAEVTKLIVYALGYEDLAKMLDGAIKAFPDVELNHWANGYISVATTQRASVANNRRIAIGYPDGKFLPENDVTYAELATMLVRIVDKNLTDKMEDNAIWATSYMSWAAEAGILHGLTIADSDKAAPRKDAFVMLYNALFELGKTNYNKVDFGAKLGVVSKLQAGKIQLNQDTKQEYKIDWNTVMTGVYEDKATGWEQLANNASLPGTLARVIVNEEGVVTHIIQLGYNGKAYADSNWRGVAKKAVSTTTSKPYAEFNRAKDDYKHITIDNVGMDITSTTKFFVADKDKNVYREVKSISDAFYYTGKENIEKVYAGYDEFKTWNEAKVIVFGKVEKDFYGKELVRVIRSANSKFDYWAQNTEGKEQEINFRDTNVFPGSYKAVEYDVLNLNAYANNIDEILVIDAKEDNVYEIKSVNLNKKEITLRDKFNFSRELSLRDTDFFLKGDVKEHALVQVKLDGNNVDVLSVVPKTQFALKGKLPQGKDDDAVVGEVITSKLGEVREVRMLLDLDNREMVYKLSNLLTPAEEALLIPGNKVRVTITEGKIFENYATVVKIVAEADGLAAKAETAIKDAVKAVEGVKANDILLKAANVKVTEANTAIKDANTELTEAKAELTEAKAALKVVTDKLEGKAEADYTEEEKTELANAKAVVTAAEVKIATADEKVKTAEAALIKAEADVVTYKLAKEEAVKTAKVKVDAAEKALDKAEKAGFKVTNKTDLTVAKTDLAELTKEETK